MNVIVFSKDRACQLELFIRSMKIYFKEFKDNKINVLYTFSDKKFEEGYEELKKIHNDVNINYVQESKKFKDHVMLLMNPDDNYTVFFVDDIVFKNPFTMDSKQVRLFVGDENILCVSLRLHTNLTYCYPAQIHMVPPKFEDNLTFRWMHERGDYGYPMSLDGHIFRTKEIFPLLKVLTYTNPNSLESTLAYCPLNKPKMICFEESAIMNLPVNRVQTFNTNICGNVSANFLNDQFLDGNIIDMEKMKGFKNISCHQEVDINLIKING